MASIIQLDPPIPVTLPEGDARAVIYTDYGRNEYAQWTCYLLKSGEIRHANDPDVRVWECASDHRFSTSPFNRKAGPKSGPKG